MFIFLANLCEDEKDKFCRQSHFVEAVCPIQFEMWGAHVWRILTNMAYTMRSLVLSKVSILLIGDLLLEFHFIDCPYSIWYILLYILCLLCNPRHCRSATHHKALEQWIRSRNEDEPMPIQEEAQAMMACQGFSLTHGPQRVSRFREEFQLWATHVFMDITLTKHKYVWELAKGELTCFHEGCFKVSAKTDETTGRCICEQCDNFACAAGALRCALRFAKKHWTTRILHARLFKCEQAAQDIETEFRKTAIFKHNSKMMSGVLNKSNQEMQQYLGCLTEVPHHSTSCLYKMCVVSLLCSNRFVMSNSF